MRTKQEAQTQDESPDECPDLDAVRERVYTESKLFRQKLPSLLTLHADQWVVFRNGKVVSVHASMEEAYYAGIERFGEYGGHIVAVVREPEPVTFGA